MILSAQSIISSSTTIRRTRSASFLNTPFSTEPSFTSIFMNSAAVPLKIPSPRIRAPDNKDHPKIFKIRAKNSSRISVAKMNSSIGGVVGVNDGVIIVDHGSRRKESNLMLNEFVEMFRARTGYRIVEPAHMELAEPSIKDAFEACVTKGASRVILSPFFLFPGRHWQQDIPALAAEASRASSCIPYIITAPLGLHELLVDVTNDRINHCISHVAGVADECSVCAGTGRCKLYQPEQLQTKTLQD